MSKDVLWEDVIGYAYADESETVIELEVIIRDSTPQSNDFLLEEAEIQKARNTAQLFMPKVVERDDTLNGRLVHIVEYHIPEGAVLTEQRMYYYADISAALDRQLTPNISENIANKPTYTPLRADDKAFIDKLIQEYKKTAQKPVKPRFVPPVMQPTHNRKPTGEKKSNRDWSAYTRGQKNEFEYFGYYLKGLLDSIVEEETEPKIGRPSISLKDGLFCMIDRAHHNLSWRRYHSLAIDAYQKGFVSYAPEPNTMSQFSKRKDITEILATLLAISATPLASVERHFAVDSSGFRTTTYSDWFSEKHNVKMKNVWKKMHIVVGTRTNVIAALRITDGYGSDTKQFPALMKDIEERFNVVIVSGDKGYTSRENYKIADEMGIQLYAPFKKNTRVPPSNEFSAWKRAYEYASEHPDEFSAVYHKRSNVETTFSSIKQKLGETINARNEIGQINELYCKAIAYNIGILIMMSSVLGIIPEFVLPTNS